MFFAVVAVLCLNPASLSVNYIYIYKSSILYVFIVRVLLLEHEHEVVSSSAVILVKLVLDVRRSNSFILEGRKVAQAERCNHNVIVFLTL